MAIGGRLRAIPIWAVHEVHLAGFTRNRFEDGEILVDTHSQRVDPAVQQLAKSELTFRNEYNLMKMAIKVRLLLWKLTHGK